MAVVNRETERLSVAAFHNPDLDLEIGPSPSLLNSKNPARFGRIIAMDYLRCYFSGKLEGKSYLDVIRIRDSEGAINDEYFSTKIDP
ncbi:hypothetical protein V2J09_010079 [Rumex salicifolius]